MKTTSGSVIGYRKWEVGLSTDKPVLLFPSGNHPIWPVGVVKARSSPRMLPDNLVGIYAKKRPGYEDLCSDAGFLFGEIELFGHVVEHQDGYRGEFARIVDIYDKVLVNDTKVIGGEAFADTVEMNVFHDTFSALVEKYRSYTWGIPSKVIVVFDSSEKVLRELWIGHKTDIYEVWDINRIRDVISIIKDKYLRGAAPEAGQVWTLN